MTTTPNPPSRALVGLAIASGIFDAALWLAALVTFAIRWGDRMAGDEVRLSLTALAFGAVTTALWAKVLRMRNCHQTFADYAPFKARLDELGQRLAHLDQGLEAMAGRTARLAKHIEQTKLEEHGGEKTGDIIHMAQTRPHLYGVKSI